MKDVRPGSQDFSREEAFYAKLWESEPWSTAAPNDDEAMRAEKMTQLIEAFVVPGMQNPDSMKILDLGCGRGWLTHHLSRFGTASGIDPVAAGVERARQLFPNLDFRACNTRTLVESGMREHFDLVVASEVIEHIPDNEKEVFLREARALLRPGGYLLLTTPRGELWARWETLNTSRQPIEQWVRERDLARLAVSAGLIVLARDRVCLPETTSLALPRLPLVARLSRSIIFGRLRTSSIFNPVRPWLRSVCGLYQVALLRRPEEAGS